LKKAEKKDAVVSLATMRRREKISRDPRDGIETKHFLSHVDHHLLIWFFKKTIGEGGFEPPAS
jgi:hypothetical protein